MLAFVGWMAILVGTAVAIVGLLFYLMLPLFPRSVGRIKRWQSPAPIVAANTMQLFSSLVVRFAAIVADALIFRGAICS